MRSISMVAWVGGVFAFYWVMALFLATVATSGLGDRYEVFKDLFYLWVLIACFAGTVFGVLFTMGTAKYVRWLRGMFDDETTNQNSG